MLQEEIGRAFRIAQAQWKAYGANLYRTDLDAVGSARAFVEEFLRDALGYAGAGARRRPLSANAAFPGCSVRRAR
jgi:hypothetical protein